MRIEPVIVFFKKHDILFINFIVSVIWNWDESLENLGIDEFLYLRDAPNKSDCKARDTETNLPI
jgi:hypothetical protein